MNVDEALKSEFQQLITLLRSIVNARKQPCLLSTIMRDYQDLENRPLPYRKYGFNSIDALFKQSKQFEVFMSRGEVYLSAIVNIRSAHVASLVRQQKSSRKQKRIVRPPIQASNQFYLHQEQRQQQVQRKNQEIMLRLQRQLQLFGQQLQNQQYLQQQPRQQQLVQLQLKQQRNQKNVENEQQGLLEEQLKEFIHKTVEKELKKQSAELQRKYNDEMELIKKEFQKTFDPNIYYFRKLSKIDKIKTTAENFLQKTFQSIGNNDQMSNKNAIASDTIDDAIAPEKIAAKLESPRFLWSEKNWELYIINCVSTTKIWACLRDDNYNGRFNALMSKINSHMAKNKVRPDVIAPEHIYLVEHRSGWHRVRVESVDKVNQKTLCFYVDFGDREYLPASALYICDSKFLNLAGRAVFLSLFGLEDFAEHPNAMKVLENRLLNRAVIGKIVTKDTADLVANGKIHVIVFDTSSMDDNVINLNLLLQDEICKESLPPQLMPDGGISLVNITNIHRRNGDISLQIINADSQYVNQMLRQIIESKFNRVKFKCSPEDLQSQQVLLVHDDDEGDDHCVKWYRARLINLKQDQNFSNNPDHLLGVRLIDYNVKRRIPVSEIFKLESLSMALSKFPPQAIRVKLHNIPEFNKSIIARIRALLPYKCQGFVRVEIPGRIPKVTILRKMNGPDMPFCNINEDLQMVFELQKGEAFCPKKTSSRAAFPLTAARLQSPIGLFRSLTLTPASVPLKIYDLPKLREYEVQLKSNDTFPVNVISVCNPQSFTVQPYNEDYKRLLNIMKALQEFCTNNDAYITADMVEIGQAYAAKKGDYYYRAIVKFRCGEVINVSFCDFGDSGTVHGDQLMVLPAEFRQLPIMGISSRLYDIKANSDDLWSANDIQRFRDLVIGKNMSSFIIGSSRDETDNLVLFLDLVDVVGEEYVNIRQVLLDEKRALPLIDSPQ